MPQHRWSSVRHLPLERHSCLRQPRLQRCAIAQSMPTAATTRSVLVLDKVHVEQITLDYMLTGHTRFLWRARKGQLQHMDLYAFDGFVQQANDALTSG